mmetsp:Transcript_22685/g.33169  ORF Transcript_22685/g.33169 Transcript_22685/m.33169 type:complete len:209 (-) Transcript_22685:5224-5850(-)
MLRNQFFLLFNLSCHFLHHCVCLFQTTSTLHVFQRLANVIAIQRQGVGTHGQTVVICVGAFVSTETERHSVVAIRICFVASRNGIPPASVVSSSAQHNTEATRHLVHESTNHSSVVCENAVLESTNDGCIVGSACVGSSTENHTVVSTDSIELSPFQHVVVILFDGVGLVERSQPHAVVIQTFVLRAEVDRILVDGVALFSLEKREYR